MAEVTFVKDSGYRRTRKRAWGSQVNAGSKWEKEESNFGAVSLEKMGWEKGKGLGANQQGNTEHIKVARLTDGKGLGKADERTSMKWVANVTGYAGVLAKLNAQYSAPEDAPAAAETTLEPRAAAAAPMYSQQQDTYRKRLKHKDARSYSHADLTAILGGKRQPVAPVKVEPVREREPVYGGMFVMASSHLAPTQGGHLLGPIAEIKREGGIKLETAVKVEMVVKLEPVKVEPVKKETVAAAAVEVEPVKTEAADAVEARRQRKERKRERREKRQRKRERREARKARKARKSAKHSNSASGSGSSSSSSD